MTKLEEEFAKAFVNKGTTAKEMRAINAKIAAEVAKKYIEKALDVNPLIEVNNMCGMVTDEEVKSKWLKENGIIE